MTTQPPAAPQKIAGVERFKNVFLGGRTSATAGELVIAGDNEEKTFYWKSTTSANTVSVPKESVDRVEWVFTTRGYSLRIWKKRDEGTTEFSNLRDTDFTRLVELFEKYLTGIDFKKAEVSARGVNWGDAHFHGNMLSFDIDGQEEFTVALPDVKNCTKHGKNELILEFHDDDTAQKTDDMLVEIRFVVPTQEDENVDNPFDQLHQKIVEKADISSETGDLLVSFEGLQFVTPRGKYNIDFHKKYIRLHGRSYSFKILYKSISTLFLLPKPGQSHMYFVVSLDTPIRQGQKAYYHLVIQFDKNATFKKEKPLVLHFDDKELEKYQDKGLKKEMDGKEYEVVAKVFRALAERKLIGAGKFTSFTNDNAIKCSMKANEGHLFFLEKSLFFLHKPALYMRHEEIKSFKFARTDNRAGGSRYFDLLVLLKNGKSWTFSNINKNEQDNLITFINNKGLHIENLNEMQEAKEAQTSNYADIMGDDDSEDDEDFVADAHDSDEDDREFEEFTTKGGDKKEDDEDDEEVTEVSESKPKESKKRKREDEDKPKKKKKSADDEEKPKKKKKKADDEEKPKKKKKKADDEEKPKKKKKKATDGEEKPKKKKSDKKE
jgi:structure-specific recognition protein 1